MDDFRGMPLTDVYTQLVTIFKKPKDPKHVSEAVQDLQDLREGALDILDTIYKTQTFALQDFLFICTYAGDDACKIFFSDDAKKILDSLTKKADSNQLVLHGIRLVAFEMMSGNIKTFLIKKADVEVDDDSEEEVITTNAGWGSDSDVSD